MYSARSYAVAIRMTFGMELLFSLFVYKYGPYAQVFLASNLLRWESRPRAKNLQQLCCAVACSHTCLKFKVLKGL